MESRAKLFGHSIHQQLIPFPLGLLFTAAVVGLFGASWLLRNAGIETNPGALALALSFAGGGLSVVTGWLGGELVDRLGMAVAAFIREAGSPFGERELALLYGAAAVMLLLTGAGRYSIDARLRGPTR
jgi:uncharacterized membrane protein YphA (DoxX/SURF4 family)